MARYQRKEWPNGSFLAGLAPSDRQALLSLGTLCHYRPGAALVVEGDRTTDVLLLLRGLAKITATAESGRPALLAIRAGGDLVGELAAIDSTPRIATATAAGVISANRIGAPEFRHFLMGHPMTALTFGSVVATKLRWATRRRVDFGGHHVQGRLARILLELLTSYGRATADGHEITVALTQRELAGIIGASEPATHRALAALRRSGSIATRYRKVLVIDRERLTALAGFD
ncbi:Crp/Fnr family transcriptional regulator [Nonomuraea sp. NEAU-A123]|uniref:Crp/Fnr family transcriptional regulator n=1 Tax=Nonomuraea sp. NEAU-A123 TaxID=2839649 RepID=UPI001BE40862|nr:Crp/Fnr family transcriptional regulator [Nonomuraea sp. NEAU-A123]MBT2227840.1 Crp/Fnr family transcriptional regulator [Nonomuraea sp. NEAU-A123]